MSKDFNEWIGRTRQAYDSMAAETMKRFAATMDRNPALVVDEDPLSPCAHWFYFTPLEPLSELAEDGHPHKGDFLPPVNLPRRMWAGGRVKNLAPLRTGRPATKTSTITKIEHKSGRTGELCFVTVVHRIEQEGKLCVEEEQDIVYRDGGTKGETPRRSVPLPARPDWTDSWQPDAVQLFRFSAITFNGHRIHYDADYCRDVEGYPAPVVHGPLLVHRILQAFASRYPARCITRISYRAVGPVYQGESVNVGGSDIDISEWGIHDGYRSASTQLYVYGTEGRIGMHTELHWEEAVT